MRFSTALGFSLALTLCGCTALERTAHMYRADAPVAQSFQYKDGGSSYYYAFVRGDTERLDTAVFFYGATGCPSWKSVMPDYVNGLNINARVFALNKRFVADRSLGLSDCGLDFLLANNPEQWVSDYTEFISAQLNSMTPKPKHVVLVGVSEGAWPAARIASSSREITHLAIIGSGGYTMRKSLATLKDKGDVAFDVNAGWMKITTDPKSVEKSWFGNAYRWWTDVMDLDPISDLLPLNIPILVGIGEKDKSVPVESVQFLQLKFKEASKSNLLVKIYPGADHRLDANGTSHRSDFFEELGHLLQGP